MDDEFDAQADLGLEPNYPNPDLAATGSKVANINKMAQAVYPNRYTLLGVIYCLSVRRQGATAAQVEKFKSGIVGASTEEILREVDGVQCIRVERVHKTDRGKDKLTLDWDVLRGMHNKL